MLLLEILAPQRRLVITQRFSETFNTFRQAYPKITETLKNFIEFRLTHKSDDPYASKDTPFNNYLRGYRHFHLVHGRVILIYQNNESTLRLFIVVNHHDYDTRHGQETLLKYLQTTSDFTPMASPVEKVLTSEQKEAITSLFFEFAAEDRNGLEHAIQQPDLSELMEFTRLLIDNPWSEAEKDQATFNAFGGKANLIATVARVLYQTAPKVRAQTHV